MAYEHTQTGKLHWLLIAAGIICVVGAVATWGEARWAAWLCLGAAGMCAALVCSFRTLTVRDEGDALLIVFGPWAFWRKRIPYDRISEPRAARSKLVDGWGIHWFPGRGWTWNLWTFDCVEMNVNGKPFRVGTDDSDGLAAFLQSRVAK